MLKKQASEGKSGILNNENLFIEYAETAAHGSLPEVQLPEDFPDDPVWQNWPGQIYLHLFSEHKKASETRISAEDAAEEIHEFLAGNSGKNRELLLPHLYFRQHGQHSKVKIPDFTAAMADLYLFLQQQQGEKWLSTEELIMEGSRLPEVAGCLDPDYSADYIYYETRGEYRNFLGDSGTRDEQRYLESPLLQRQACIEPLIVNYLAAVIVLGLAEVRYHPWLENFSPWEGISHIRLTPWGKYVFGISRNAPQWKSTGCAGFSDEGLFALLKRDSPRCRSLLEKCGDEIAPGQFHISAGKIATLCGSHEELEQLIDDLKAAAIDGLPPSWEEFFTRLRYRVLQLPVDSEWALIDLPEDQTLTGILTGSPEFENLFLKVEGMKILVRRENLEIFRRNLQKKGFFPKFC